MPDGFTVTPDALRLAAEAAAGLADRLAQLPLGAAVSRVPAAVPGGAAAGAAELLAMAWSNALVDLAGALTRHATLLAECGQAYESVDAECTALFGY